MSASGLSLTPLPSLLAAPEPSWPPGLRETARAMLQNLEGPAPAGLEAPRRMDEFMRRNPVSFWVAALNGECVGYVAVGFPDGPRKEILPGDSVAMGWYIHPGFRRRGLATQAIRLILEKLQDLQVSSVRADIEDANRPSQRLAEKFGFSVSAMGTNAGGAGWKSYVLVVP